MAFLLVSTLLALSISNNQAEIGQEKNRAEEIAFKSANNAFNSVIQQTTAAKEGYAGAAYSRVMPFSSFDAEDNWIEIKQETSEAGPNLKNAYNALNLFAIFAEKKWQEGMQVNIKSVIQDTEWKSSATAYPRLTYIVLPQCLKFSAGNGTEAAATAFEAGTTTDGCIQNFDPTSIKSQEFEIKINYSNYQSILCKGVFESGCAGPSGGNPEQPYYAKIAITIEECGSHCNEGGFVNGTRIISGNLSGASGDYIEVVLKSEPNFKLEFPGYLAKISKGQDRTNSFAAKIVFTNPFDEISLAPGYGQFDFGIKNTGFEICRATNGEGCLCSTGGYPSGGKCWYLGGIFQSCTTVCATHGGTNPATCSGWKDTGCTICKALANPTAACNIVTPNVAYPAYYSFSPKTCYAGTGTATCSPGAPRYYQRICACNS